MIAKAGSWAILIVLVLAGFAWAEDATPLETLSRPVELWHPHDFAFRGDAGVDNPFRIQFSAIGTGPGGARLRIPGFFNGDGTWVVRFSPTQTGKWTIVTHSTSPALDNQQAAFVCAPNGDPHVHGGLRVDSRHPHHFIYEDNTRYFLMGYECDWLWAMDMTRPDLPTIEPFLDKLAASGFNHVILNAYAYDTAWRKGRTAEDDFGPPPMDAWEGTNQHPDHSRFNLAYWQHYDRVIDALFRRGMVAHILIKVYNKMVNWPAAGSAEDDLYFRWLIARYSAYPNVNWDLSKEANNEKDLAYKIGRLRFIRGNDPYHRLITVHDDRITYDRGDYNRLLDYRSDQQHANWRQSLLDHRLQRDWPVVNAEFGYEHGPGGINDKTYGVVQSPQEVCRRAWEVCMAGGYPVYYYTYTAWDVIRPQDSPEGYRYFKHLREFFEQTRYWRLQPADDLINTGYCLAEPGREYVVYLNKAAPFTLKLDGPGSALKPYWYNPLTGERRDGVTLGSGTVTLKPPAEWTGRPVAVQVGHGP